MRRPSIYGCHWLGGDSAHACTWAMVKPQVHIACHDASCLESIIIFSIWHPAASQQVLCNVHKRITEVHYLPCYAYMIMSV
jgi:hypothetical protein